MSSNSTAVSIHGVSKRYVISHNDERSETLGEAVYRRACDPFRRSRKEVFWALKDISFDVQAGEIIGIIGQNGAGKSTLLKILSRITPPTHGEIDLHGRVGSLLEVGTGFHRELTGRENIYLNGGILGMSRREIDRRFDEIVDFAGMDKFLDTPVKRYSSGMFVRLAFAVAAHLEPEILIVDEVLAVGDAEFQKKCLGKIKDVSRDGRTILFVSHNMAAVQSLCERCVWLEHGCVREIGPTDAIGAAYLNGVVQLQSDADLRYHPARAATNASLLHRVRLVNRHGKPLTTLPMGESLHVQVLINPYEELRQPLIGIGVNSRNGQRVFTVHTKFSADALPSIDEPTWVECVLPNLSLLPGTYTLKLAAGVPGEDLDAIDNAIAFEVVPRDVFASGAIPNSSQGVVYQESKWRVLAPLLEKIAVGNQR